MSKIYDPKFNRSKWGNYHKDKNFTSIVGGTDAYFLEDEMNEMQWIQNEARAEILRTQYHSGIVNKHSLDDIIVQSEDDFKKNLFSFHKLKVLVNGYLINVAGNLGWLNNNEVLKNQQINNIILSEPPEKGYRDDFVYLEVWFKEVNYQNDLWFHGNKNNYNGIIPNDLLDQRINGETCRRVQMQWAIRTVADIDFNKNINGFDNLFENGKVLAYGGHYSKSKYGFWRSDMNLDGKSDFSDKGLWVAGKGIPSEMNTIDGYVYAIPLFRIRRRNFSGYSIENYNGASLYDIALNNISDRPDGKFANIIYRDDIIDLRNMNNFSWINTGEILQRNYKKLLTNQLDFNINNNIIKEYFGINAIVPSDKTKVYLNYNNNLENNLPITNKQPNLSENIAYRFVPSVEQEGLIIENNGYISYDINGDLNTGRISMMLKLLDTYNKDLWSITDINDNTILSCIIKDGIIEIHNESQQLITKPIDETRLTINEFAQIGLVWSKNENKMYFIINDNIVTTIDINNRLSSGQLKSFIIGYCNNSNNFCKNVILDEIEYSTEYNTSFSVLPVDFKNGDAKVTLDMQKGRRLYTTISSKSIMTSKISQKSNSSGQIIFTINAPAGSLFSVMTPRLYHDNEAIMANVIWSGLGTNNLQGTLNNLGPDLEYNFILVYEVQFDENQGLSSRPEKMFKVLGEKLNEEFFPVRYDKKFEQYRIDRLAVPTVENPNLPREELFAYNPMVSPYLGFGCAIKYYITNINGNKFTIPRKIYNQDIISVYDINVYNKIDKKNLLKTFTINKDSISIELNNIIFSTDTIELILGIGKAIAVYNNIAGGIENLVKVEKIEFVGDGVSNVFKKRLDTRALGSLSSMINGETQYIALVDNKVKPVDVQFKDTFIIFNFSETIPNKSSIVVYVNTEYEPVRSERFEVWYETFTYQGNFDKDYIAKLNECDIVKHFDSIFVITEGLNYPLENSLNKNYISSTNLPSIETVDTKLIPTKILNNATNIKVNIDYAKTNDNDFNDSIPLLNKLKLKISNKKIHRGYTGYITIDDKSLCSNMSLNVSTPHLNIMPLLIKDKNDKLIMGIITTYNEGKEIIIDSEYSASAFDAFQLDENILIK